MIKQKRYKSLSFIIFCAIIISLGNLTYSFQLTCMNDALTTMIQVFEISDKWKSFIQGALTSIPYMGCFFGSLIIRFIMSHGNRIQILAADICLFIGSILLTFDSIVIFLIGRFIIGLGCGMNSVVVPTFLQQFSPTEVYGIVGGINSIIYSSGVVLTQSAGLLFEKIESNLETPDTLTWQLYFFTPAIFVLARSILLYIFVKYSAPVHYARKNEQNKLEQSIKFLYLPEFVDHQIEYLNTFANSKISDPAIFSKKYRKRMILACYLQFLFQFSGLNAIMLYSTMIFNELVSSTFATILTLLVAILKVSCYSLSAYIAQKYGRRNSFVYGVLLVSISNAAVLGCSFFLENVSETNKYYEDCQIVMIFFIFLFLFGNFNSLGPLVPVYVAEIVPPKGIQFSWMIHWTSGFLVVQFFPVFKDSFGMSSCFIVFTCASIVGEYIIYNYLIETKDRNDSEIDAIFNNRPYQKLNQVQSIEEFRLSDKST